MCIHNSYYFFGQANSFGQECDHLSHHIVTWCPFRNSDECPCPRSVINRIPGICESCQASRRKESLKPLRNPFDDDADMDLDGGCSGPMTRKGTQLERTQLEDNLSLGEGILFEEGISAVEYQSALTTMSPLSKTPSRSLGTQLSTLMGPPPKPASRREVGTVELKAALARLEAARDLVTTTDVVERKQSLVSWELAETLVKLRLKEVDEETY